MYSVTVFLFLNLFTFSFAHQTYKKNACEHQVLELKCQAGELIEIHQANYGRTVPGSVLCSDRNSDNTNCRSVNSLPVVQKFCEKKESCRIAASNSLFGDPCVGTFKYLEVEYSCPKRKIVCENSLLAINCEANKVINIKSANYGRTVNGDILCPMTNHDSKTDCWSPNSIETVKKMCDNRQTCSIYANNQVFGDPCVGTRKYLEVTYKCEDVQKKPISPLMNLIYVDHLNIYYNISGLTVNEI